MSRAYGEVVGADLEDAQRRAETRWAPWADVGMLWRVEAVRYSACELTVSGGEYYFTTEPRLEIFGEEVGKLTPCGARLRYSGRWVDLRDGAKQYASRTVAEAVAQFARRRKGQLYILARQTRRAQEDLSLTTVFNQGGRNAYQVGD